MYSIITQAIGFIALGFIISSFQFKERFKILIVMCIGLILFTLHFALLGAWTGSLMNLIEVGLTYIAYKKEISAWAKNILWLYLFIFIYIIVGSFTYNSTIDILPIIAQIVAAIAIWQNNTKLIRYIMLIPRPLWFIYNYVVMSYAGLIAEILIGGSVLISIWRYRKDKNN